jgi:hypothetical protein
MMTLSITYVVQRSRVFLKFDQADFCILNFETIRADVVRGQWWRQAAGFFLMRKEVREERASLTENISLVGVEYDSEKGIPHILSHGSSLLGYCPPTACANGNA